MFRELSPTVYRFETRGDPRRSFTIDSTTMHIVCEDGSEYKTASFWWLNEPLTKADQESMDLCRIKRAVLDGSYIRIEVMLNNEYTWVYFKRYI